MTPTPDPEALHRELAACLEEALRLQSRIMELTEQVHAAAGMATPADRALRGKVTGLCYGLLAHLDELNRLLREEGGGG